MATRTAQLAAGLTVTMDPGAIVYTVPPATLTLVKSFIAFNYSAGLDSMRLYVKSAGGTIFYLGYFRDVPSNGIVQLGPDDFWVALDPGDQVYVSAASTTTWTYVLSGAELIE